jgi:AcrR family transcriptional regulator
MRALSRGQHPAIIETNVSIMLSSYIVSRPIDKGRPEELQNAIVQYLVKHGIANLSLRPLAKAVGSSPRVLLYYFGSKEKMLIKLLAEIRHRQSLSFSQIKSSTLEGEGRAVWKQMSAPASEPLFRLFFEAYGLALRCPQRYREFLRATISDWLDFIARDLRSKGLNHKDARALATILLDGLRGFMLDYCTTHDRKRIDRAVDRWLQSVCSVVPVR